jgi:multisubunit Na+/H+ antiporter MnhC subunit
MLSALVATQLLTSCWAVRPLPPGPWLVCIARVFQLTRNAAAASRAPSKPPPPPPPPPVLPSRLTPYHGPWGAMTVLPTSPPSSLTQALWLTSLAISLACAVVASLLKKRARRVSVIQLSSRWRRQRAHSSKGELAYSGEAKWSLVDMTRFFYAIHACHLVCAVLYLWGLGIPLLHESNPHRLSFLLVVVGSGVTFFLGQCLIVSAFSRVTVQYPRHGAQTTLLIYLSQRKYCIVE